MLDLRSEASAWIAASINGARQEGDERYADLVLGKRNWQIAAAGSIGVSLILPAGIVWLSAKAGLLQRQVYQPDEFFTDGKTILSLAANWSEVCDAGRMKESRRA